MVDDEQESGGGAVRDRIVLGLGGTVDYEVSCSSAVLERLVLASGLAPAELSSVIEVNTERDLLRCLLAFLRDGTGGERFVASTEIVEAFAAHFDPVVALGGTCTRAALAMDKLGVKSTLHLVSIDDTIRRLLPPGCSYVCSATEDTSHPHLILQFAAGTSVGAGEISLCAPYANRVIFTNDPPHETMLLHPELGALLAEAQVFLISGLNSLRDPDLLNERLTTLEQLLGSPDTPSLVYYEDAGFHQPALSSQVNARLDPLVDVHGMNEDELQSYLGRTCNLLDVAEMAAALLQIQTLSTAPTCVIHTRYWSLAVGRDAASFAPALRGGIAMASARYLHGDGYTETDYHRVADGPVNERGAVFAEQLNRRLPGVVCCEPALVLVTAVPTTVGLGDTFVGGFLAAWTGG